MFLQRELCPSFYISPGAKSHLWGLFWQAYLTSWNVRLSLKCSPIVFYYVFPFKFSHMFAIVVRRCAIKHSLCSFVVMDMNNEIGNDWSHSLHSKLFIVLMIVFTHRIPHSRYTAFWLHYFHIFFKGVFWVNSFWYLNINYTPIFLSAQKFTSTQ